MFQSTGAATGWPDGFGHRRVAGRNFGTLRPPVAIVCDRWREAKLRQTLAEQEYPRCELVTKGQSYMDGGADVREFRQACLDGYVQPVKRLMMRSAMSGARVTTDPAGNSKLAKGGQGRADPMPRRCGRSCNSGNGRGPPAGCPGGSAPDFPVCYSVRVVRLFIGFKRRVKEMTWRGSF